MRERLGVERRKGGRELLPKARERILTQPLTTGDASPLERAAEYREEHRQSSNKGAQIARAYTGCRTHLADLHELALTTIRAKSLNELHKGSWGQSVELASWRLAA